MRFCNASIRPFLSTQTLHSHGNSNNPSSLVDCLDDDGKLDVDRYRRLLLEEEDLFAHYQVSLAAAIREYTLEDESFSSADEDYVGGHPNRRELARRQSGTRTSSAFEGFCHQQSLLGISSILNFQILIAQVFTKDSGVVFACHTHHSWSWLNY